uniref:Uncharacterized protein n=1 Tax=Oryza punctata TaxID=4537 RepID=A0A0E0LJR4_ORYPU
MSQSTLARQREKILFV